LHDYPDLVHGPLTHINGAAGEQGSAERKKALKKAKREQQKLEKAEAEKREAKKAASTGKTADGETKKEDSDPLGKKLLETQDPLKDALKFVGPLLEYNQANIEAQTAAFEVQLRRKKYLLAMKCLLAAHAIDPSNPALHVQLLRFRQALDSLPEPLPTAVAEIIGTGFEKLLPKSQDLNEWNNTFLESQKGSVTHVQAALTARQLLNPATKEQCEKDLIATLELDDVTIDQALAGLELLDEWKSSLTVRRTYEEKAQLRWTGASLFQSQQ